MLRLAALLLLADVSAAFGAVMASQRPVSQPLLGSTTTHFTPRHPVPALSSLAPARALVLRGGAGVLSRLPASLNPASPDGLFNVLFLGLATFCAALVVAARDSQTAEACLLLLYFHTPDPLFPICRTPFFPYISGDSLARPILAPHATPQFFLHGQSLTPPIFPICHTPFSLYITSIYF